jgi:hypothetical protein
MSAKRQYFSKFGEQTAQPGFIWADPASLSLSSLADNIATDLTSGDVADSRFKRLFDSGSASAQQVFNGIVSAVTDGIANLPASQRTIPAAGGVSQTQSLTATALKYNPIVYNLNKFYKSYWKPKFDSQSNGTVSPYVIRREAIVEATFVEHGCTITAVNLVDGRVRLTSSGKHGLYNKMHVDLNTNNFYVKKIDATTIEMYGDAELTAPFISIIGISPGALTLNFTETHRYRVNSLRVYHWGEKKYGFYNSGTFTRTNAARFDGAIYTPQNLAQTTMTSYDDPDQGYYSRWPWFTVTTNSSGYLTGITLDTESPGQYANPGWSSTQGKVGLISIGNKENAGFMAAGPDTQALWETPGYNSSGDKQWPTTVQAVNATIAIDSPTAVVQSQNGRVFTRSSGMPTYTVKIAYPPMTKEQFRPILAKIHQARGQHIEFHLNLSAIVPKVFARRGTALSDKFAPVINYPGGSTAFRLYGGDVLKYNAIAEGDYIQAPEIGNGEIAVIPHVAHTSAWGSVDVRSTVPTYRSMNQPTTFWTGQTWMVATLDSDTVEVSISTIETYGIELTFKARNWS